MIQNSLWIISHQQECNCILVGHIVFPGLSDRILHQKPAFFSFDPQFGHGSLIMFCSAIHAIIIDASLRVKHAPKVRRAWRASLAFSSKVSPPSVNSKSYYSYEYGNERIRERQQSRNDKCYCKVDANPHRRFKHKSSSTIVHLYKSNDTLERLTNKICPQSSFSSFTFLI